MARSVTPDPARVAPGPAFERYGEQYDAYRRAVPAWWPRLRPWDGR